MSYAIMIIDDEQMILDMLRDQFEMEQYQVITAKSGEEALQKLTQQPDIILLDINMPQVDGIEVCKAIRDMVTCPILFLTARDQDTDKIEGFAAGVIGIGITLLLIIPINAIVQHLTGIASLGAVLPPVAAVLLVAISMLLTFIAGLIPSRFAAKKDPVVALRTE